jgi:uncharacterized protein (DUF1697 family)
VCQPVVMTRAVAAFLKGVNVGGNKKIDMVGLRKIAAEVGCGSARTYLQSGNLVFSCTRKDIEGLAADIEEAIERTYSFRSSVVLRDRRSLAAAIEADPLTHIAVDPSRHLIGFLVEPPNREAVKAAEAESTDTDLVSVVGRHLYMWCPAGISASPLFKVNFDRILGTTVTVRNWNTVTKVAGMLGDVPV